MHSNIFSYFKYGHSVLHGGFSGFRLVFAIVVFALCGPGVLPQDIRALHLSPHSSALTPSLATALVASVCHAEQRKMQKKAIASL